MDLEFTVDQEELRTSARAFLAAECPVGLVRKVVEGGHPTGDPTGHPTADPTAGLWRAMASLDWPALNIPEGCGGMGLGTAEVAVVAEELGAVAAPGPFLATATQFVPAVLRAGSPDQQARLLGPVAAGERTGALAVADHPARWSTGHISATADRTGSGWVLNGTKHMVCVGPADAADLVVVARPSTATMGTGLFVVPRERLEIRPERVLDGSRPLSLAVMDGVEVPDDDVLGDPGEPAVAAALERVVAEAALGFAVELIGTCRTLFDMTVRYAKDRHQFGVPIGSFQAVKHKMADLYVALERARSLVYYAVATVDEDDPGLLLAVAMAKAAADDCQRLVCREAIQTFGGIGFTWEADVHLYVKRAMTSGAMFGSAADHRLAVARLLGVPA